jgi:hypothetical protein
MRRRGIAAAALTVALTIGAAAAVSASAATVGTTPTDTATATATASTSTATATPTTVPTTSTRVPAVKNTTVSVGDSTDDILLTNTDSLKPAADITGVVITNGARRVTATVTFTQLTRTNWSWITVGLVPANHADYWTNAMGQITFYATAKHGPSAWNSRIVSIGQDGGTLGCRARTDISYGMHGSVTFSAPRSCIVYAKGQSAPTSLKANATAVRAIGTGTLSDTAPNTKKGDVVTFTKWARQG